MGFKIGLDMINNGRQGILESVPVIFKEVKRPRNVVSLTFKDLIESSVESRGFMFVGLNKSHDNGKALFKITNGKRGCVVYLDEAVLYVEGDRGWKPIHINELMDSMV